MLHGLLDGIGDSQALDFALAAAVLKHSVPGDFNRVGVTQIESLLRGDAFAIKR